MVVGVVMVPPLLVWFWLNKEGLAAGFSGSRVAASALVAPRDCCSSPRTFADTQPTPTHTHSLSLSPTHASTHIIVIIVIRQGLMKTASARRAAEQRHAFMEAFVEQFLGEWEGRR